MKFTKENVEIAINEYFWQADFESCGDLIAEIYNLDDTPEKYDTPEKVVLPKFIAVYLDKAKSDISLMRVFEIANGYLEYDCFKNEYNWIRKNSETFARAWLNVYEVEKEPLYHVVNKDGGLMLFKYENVVSVTPAPEVMTIKDYGHKPYYQLTEAEIKNYDERYWSFAVPAND